MMNQQMVAHKSLGISVKKIKTLSNILKYNTKVTETQQMQEMLELN